jgi:hypothetical protein
MISIVLYIIFWWGLVLVRGVRYWVGVLTVSLFLLFRLGFRPLYLGEQYVGYELFFDFLSYAL